MLLCQVRATSGASGVLMYIDPFKAEQFYLAGVGDSNCVVGRIVGSFYAQTTEAELLCQEMAR